MGKLDSRKEQEEIGKNSERRVRNLLREQKESGEILRFWKSNPKYDREGIDFLFELAKAPGYIFPLQVKSSERYVEKFSKLHGPNIPVLIVKPLRTKFSFLASLNRIKKNCLLEANEGLGKIRTFSASLPKEEARSILFATLTDLSKSSESLTPLFSEIMQTPKGYVCTFSNRNRRIIVIIDAFELPLEREALFAINFHRKNKPPCLRIAIAPNTKIKQIADEILSRFRN